MSGIIQGHQQAVTLFRQRLMSKRMPHAWLITGPRGIGKASLVKRVLAPLALHVHQSSAETGLLGDGVLPDVPLPIGPLPDMPLSDGPHPDFTLVSSEDAVAAGKARAEIAVDSIRGTTQFLRKTSSLGGYRAAVIDSADEMNFNAQNALLKVLEEPPPDALLFLICHAENRILPTIRSRCVKLPLARLGQTDVKNIVRDHLTDLSESQFDAVSAVSNGCPGLAISIAESGALGLVETLSGAALKSGTAAQHAKAMAALSNDPGARAGSAGGKRFETALGLFRDATASAAHAIIKANPTAAGSAEAQPPESPAFPGCSDAFWNEMVGAPIDFLSAYYERITYLHGLTTRASLDRAAVLSDIALMWRFQTISDPA